MRSAFKKMMDYCTYCPKMCRFSCPVSETTKNESHTPWGKMELARWILDKNITLSQESAEPLYQCTNCLHCQSYCEHLNDVPEALREAREIAVANYAAPDSAYAVEQNFSQYNNPYGVDLRQGAKLPKSTQLGKTEAEVLFFPSCHTLKFFPDRLNTYAQLFEKLKIPVTFWQEPVVCCGEPLRALGFRQGFTDIAEIQSNLLRKYRCVVTDDAECCFSFRTHYSELGNSAPLESLHLMEFLEPYLQHSNYRTQGRVKGRLVFYHSPFLARHLKLVDLPRRLISHVLGFAPVELFQQGLDTLSFGCEGSYEQVFPEFSQGIAKRTLETIRLKRVKKILTASAKSEAQLARVSQGIEIQDIYEFFNEQILSD